MSEQLTTVGLPRQAMRMPNGVPGATMLPTSAAERQKKLVPPGRR